MEKNKTNEIDLIELFFKFYRIIKRNFLLMLIIFLLGTSISIYKIIRNRSVYNSEYIIDINKSRIVVVDQIFDNLNELLSDYIIFSKQLDLNINEVEKIQEFIFEYEKPKNETIETITVKLRILHKGIANIDSLAFKIIDYINNKPFFADRKNVRIAQIEEQIKEICLKIEETDSLQQIFMNSYINNNKLIYFNQEDIHTSLQKQKLKFISERQELERILENIDLMYVVDNITIKNKMSIMNLAVYPILGLFLGLFFIFFKELNRFDKKRKNTQS